MAEILATIEVGENFVVTSVYTARIKKGHFRLASAR